MLNRQKKSGGYMDKEVFKCECIECGHKMESKKHCKDLKCPECGGQMRREERPGPGQKDIDRKWLSGKFETKELNEDDEYYTFKGYASTFGNEDLGGDVVLQGAFNRTLKKMKPKVCYQHDFYKVIGVLTVCQEDEKGLYVEGKLPKAHSEARNVASLLKCKGIDEMSIGYNTVECEIDNDAGVRYLKDVDLFEVSFVSMAMNNRAKVTSVKSAQEVINSIESIKDVNTFLKEKGLNNTERTGIIAKIKLISERRKGEVEIVNNLNESNNQLNEAKDLINSL